MKLRRRTLALLALIPASLGAGAAGYWWHASKSLTFEGRSEIDMRIAALDDFVVDTSALIDLSPEPSFDAAHEQEALLHVLSGAAADEHTSFATQPETGYAHATIDDELQSARFSADGFAAAFGTTDYGYPRPAGGGHRGGGASGGTKPSPQQHEPSSCEDHVDGTKVASDAGTNEFGSEDPCGDNGPQHDPITQHPHPPTVPRDNGGCQQPWCNNTPLDDDSPGSGSPDDPYSPHQPYPPDVPELKPETKPTVAVPEPGSLGLLGIGLLGILASRRRSLRR